MSKENEQAEEVSDFVDYLVTELSHQQLAVLYYQALHSTATMINGLNEEGETIDYNDLHDSNIDFMASVIEDNHPNETRQ
jgi:hypothetical protein